MIKNAVVAVVFLGGGIYLAVNKEKWQDFLKKKIKKNCGHRKLSSVFLCTSKVEKGEILGYTVTKCKWKGK